MLAITWKKSNQPSFYPKEPQVLFVESCSEVKPPEDAVLIYDRELSKNTAFKKLLKRFKNSISVKAGESSKSIESYGRLLNQLSNLPVSASSKLSIYSAGGGSVGDLVGFVASTFRRGVPLCHIPTTWLAAIDSAYGGKTALNLNSAKNQLGNFYFADQVFVCRDLLSSQPSKLLRASVGEALKTSLLSGERIWDEFNEVSARHSDSELETHLWQMLPLLVKFKLKIVDQDPFEKKLIRTILNLGHTWGHVVEARLKENHGLAVLSGLRWAIEFSLWCKLLSPKAYCAILESSAGSFLPSTQKVIQQIKKIPNWEVTLRKDKKAAGKDSVNLVLLKGVGKPIVIPVPIEDIRRFNRQFGRYPISAN